MWDYIGCRSSVTYTPPTCTSSHGNAPEHACEFVVFLRKKESSWRLFEDRVGSRCAHKSVNLNVLFLLFAFAFAFWSISTWSKNPVAKFISFPQLLRTGRGEEVEGEEEGGRNEEVWSSLKGTACGMKVDIMVAYTITRIYFSTTSVEHRNNAIVLTLQVSKYFARKTYLCLSVSFFVNLLCLCFVLRKRSSSQ